MAKKYIDQKSTIERIVNSFKLDYFSKSKVDKAYTEGYNAGLARAVVIVLDEETKEVTDA